MAKARATLTIDEVVLRAVRQRAASSGRDDSDVVEEALRAQFGLDVLDELWAKTSLGDEEAMELAVEAQHATRHRRPQ